MEHDLAAHAHRVLGIAAVHHAPPFIAFLPKFIKAVGDLAVVLSGGTDHLFYRQGISAVLIHRIDGQHLGLFAHHQIIRPLQRHRGGLWGGHRGGRGYRSWNRRWGYFRCGDGRGKRRWRRPQGSHRLIDHIVRVGG